MTLTVTSDVTVAVIASDGQEVEAQFKAGDVLPAPDSPAAAAIQQVLAHSGYVQPKPDRAQPSRSKEK